MCPSTFEVCDWHVTEAGFWLEDPGRTPTNCGGEMLIPYNRAQSSLGSGMW